MSFVRRLGLVTGLAALALSGGPHPLAAQETAAAIVPDRLANGARIGAWTVSCEAVAVGETLCVLSQRLVRANDNALLAELVAFWDGAGEGRYLAARVPLGVHLASGIVIGPEGGEAETALIWQACNATLCEALVPIDATTADVLGTDGQLVMAYRPAIGAEPLVFGIETAGMDEGLAALKAAGG